MVLHHNGIFLHIAGIFYEMEHKLMISNGFSNGFNEYFMLSIRYCKLNINHFRLNKKTINQ